MLRTCRFVSSGLSLNRCEVKKAGLVIEGNVRTPLNAMNLQASQKIALKIESFVLAYEIVKNR